MNLEQIVSNTHPQHPLAQSKVASTRYFTDFVDAIRWLEPVLSEKQLTSLCEEKLQLKPDATNLPQYYQGAVETTIISHFARLSPNAFTYEPRLRPGSDKNVECASTMDGCNLNIEVKCSDFTDWENTKEKDSIKIVTAGRIPDHQATFQSLKAQLDTIPEDQRKDVELWKHKDNAMKDFLLSAHEKFADSPENVINALFVGLGDIHDIQKWWTYLFEHQGFLTSKPYIDPKSYNRVDCIIYTNLYHRHSKHQNIRNSAWNLDAAFSMFMSSQYRQTLKKDCILAFASKIINYTDAIAAYWAPGDVPPAVERNSRLAWFVSEELETKQSVFLF